MNTRRMNRLEELGRVDAEKAFTKKGARNLRDEKKRIVRELKADGGYITKKPKYITKKPKYITKKKKYITKKSPAEIQDRERMRRATGGKADMTPRRDKKMGAGGKKSGLKPVRPEQKGLSKLPRKVRNKMGYMKKGGRVGMGKAMRGGGCVR